MRSRGARYASALLAGAMLAVVPAFAAAGNEGTGQGSGGAKSRIEIKSLKSSGASGTVSSSDSSCEKGRKVTLFVIESFVSDKVDIMRSDSQGNWRSKKSLKAGEYFAKVDSVPGCRYDISATENLR